MSIVKDLLLILFALNTVVVFFVLKINFNKHKHRIYEALNHNFRVAELAQLRALGLLKSNYNPDLINEIQSSCKYNLSMIDDLCKIYHNEKSFKHNIDLSELITKVFISFSEQADSKGVTFYYKIDGPESVFADDHFLEQILHILTEKILSICKEKIACFVNIYDKKAQFSLFYTSDKDIKSDFSKNNRFSAVGHVIKAELCTKLVSLMGGKLKFGTVQNSLHYVTFCVQIVSCIKKSKVPVSTGV